MGRQRDKLHQGFRKAESSLAVQPRTEKVEFAEFATVWRGGREMTTKKPRGCTLKEKRLGENEGTVKTFRRSGEDLKVRRNTRESIKFTPMRAGKSTATGRLEIEDQPGFVQPTEAVSLQ